MYCRNICIDLVHFLEGYWDTLTFPCRIFPRSLWRLPADRRGKAGGGIIMRERTVMKRRRMEAALSDEAAGQWLWGTTNLCLTALKTNKQTNKKTTNQQKGSQMNAAPLPSRWHAFSQEQSQLCARPPSSALNPAPAFPPSQLKRGGNVQCVDWNRPNWHQPGTFGLNLNDFLAFYLFEIGAVDLVPCRRSIGSVCFVSFGSVSCNLRVSSVVLMHAI